MCSANHCKDVQLSAEMLVQVEKRRDNEMEVKHRNQWNCWTTNKQTLTRKWEEKEERKIRNGRTDEIALSTPKLPSLLPQRLRLRLLFLFVLSWCACSFVLSVSSEREDVVSLGSTSSGWQVLLVFVSFSKDSSALSSRCCEPPQFSVFVNRADNPS